ncbi:MAG: hypothetical protein ACREAA_07770 [Candidatus Polarisedimenticolia bacterium]
MAGMEEQPIYTVTVKGRRRDDGAWVIQATAAFRDDMTAAHRHALREQVRSALLQGIVREGLRARRAGATIAEVILDEGDGPQVVRPSEMGLP